MGQYSETEIKEFRAKDLRIARESILKPLIEKLPLEEIYDVQKVTELCKRYINYVYNGVAGSNVATSEEVMDIEWEQVAEGLNLTIPNATNIKILNLIFDEYKQANKVSAKPSDILSHIINRFGRYPTKKESIVSVLESMKGK